VKKDQDGLGTKSPYVSKPMMERAFMRLHAERNQWRREVYLMRVLCVVLAVAASAAWWLR
jgi:hypothetical protein